MRISGPFPIEKRSQGRDQAKIWTVPYRTKGHEWWNRRNSVVIRAKFVFWAGRAQSFLNPKKCISVSGSKFLIRLKCHALLLFVSFFGLLHRPRSARPSRRLFKNERFHICFLLLFLHVFKEASATDSFDVRASARGEIVTESFLAVAAV